MGRGGAAEDEDLPGPLPHQPAVPQPQPPRQRTSSFIYVPKKEESQLHIIVDNTVALSRLDCAHAKAVVRSMVAKLQLLNALPVDIAKRVSRACSLTPSPRVLLAEPFSSRTCPQGADMSRSVGDEVTRMVDTQAALEVRTGRASTRCVSPDMSQRLALRCCTSSSWALASFVVTLQPEHTMPILNTSAATSPGALRRAFHHPLDAQSHAEQDQVRSSGPTGSQRLQFTADRTGRRAPRLCFPEKCPLAPPFAAQIQREPGRGTQNSSRTPQHDREPQPDPQGARAQPPPLFPTATLLASRSRRPPHTPRASPPRRTTRT